MNHTMAWTDFGFEKILSEEKTQKVRNLFKDVSQSYDRMNDVMSFGVHRLWKDSFVKGLMLPRHGKVLDVAGGTGDIAVRMARQYAFLSPKIYVLDLTEDMLFQGKKNALDQGVAFLQWVCGNGECLPFPDNYFDCLTISFGLRNISHKQEALKEFKRVLKPGGYFSCMEFSRVEHDILRKLYETYSFEIIPLFGKWIAKDEAAYRYLVESIAMFPDQDTLKNMMEEGAGFKDVHYENLTHGVVAIHSGHA